MNKLNLNKETISQMDKTEMAQINGGDIKICLVSCPSGTEKEKNCCKGDPHGITISIY